MCKSACDFITHCLSLIGSLILGVYEYFKEKRQIQLFFALVTWAMTLSLHLEFPEPIIAAGYTFFSAFYRGVLVLLYVQWFASDNFCVTRRDLLAIKASNPHIDSTLDSLDYVLRRTVYIRRLGYI
jgi:hypothetical protein